MLLKGKGTCYYAKRGRVTKNVRYEWLKSGCEFLERRYELINKENEKTENEKTKRMVRVSIKEVMFFFVKKSTRKIKKITSY